MTIMYVLRESTTERLGVSPVLGRLLTLRGGRESLAAEFSCRPVGVSVLRIGKLQILMFGDNRI